MKVFNKKILVILVTICAMGKGLIACAEQSTSMENRPSKSLFGWTYLEEEKGFHVVFDASGSYGPFSGYM